MYRGEEKSPLELTENSKTRKYHTRYTVELGRTIVRVAHIQYFYTRDFYF